MDRKPLYVALIAAAFAFPMAASANDSSTNTAGKTKTEKMAGSGNDGGAEAMFSSLDKNGDGFLSKDEVKGTPHEADFASLDKDGDGKLSREEHYAAKEHVAARSKAGGTAGSAQSSSSASGDVSPSATSKSSSGTKY